MRSAPCSAPTTQPATFRCSPSSGRSCAIAWMVSANWSWRAACRDRRSLAASRPPTSATSRARTGAGGWLEEQLGRPTTWFCKYAISLRQGIRSGKAPGYMGSGSALVRPHAPFRRFRYRSSMRGTACSRPSADEGAKQTLLDTLPSRAFRGRHPLGHLVPPRRCAQGIRAWQT